MIDVNDSKFNAAYALSGKTLETGWQVMEMIHSKPHSTGGNFSICYLAQKGEIRGFLKALNFLSFFSNASPDFTEAMEEMLASFNYEKEILARCKDKRMSKVSMLLEAGIEKIEGFFIPTVPYLIVEKAEKDVREYLQFESEIDVAWKLKSIHNIAVGLQQLHNGQISHQDVKPSNILVYNRTISKLGDLGRALCLDISSPHDDLHFAGDPYYLPPEVLFKFQLPDWNERNFAIDLYLLGSLIIFYFMGVNMTTLLGKNLKPMLNWQSYRGRFNEVLPYLVESFEISLSQFKDHISNLIIADELISLVRILSYPDPSLRGDSRYKQLGNGKKYDLHTVFTKLDVLRKIAEIKIK